jgi:hypothetical protein
MSHTSKRSIPWIACGALVALAGWATAQGAGDGDGAKAKKLIENNAKTICMFTHAPSTYTFKNAQYLSTSKTKDGHFEVTYRFNVAGNLKNQKMDIAFYFKDSGEFDFVRVTESTTLYEPFKKLSASYLKEVRQSTAKLPAVAGNTTLLKRVDAANAQELCEIFIRETQTAAVKK